MDRGVCFCGIDTELGEAVGPARETLHSVEVEDEARAHRLQTAQHQLQDVRVARLDRHTQLLQALIELKASKTQRS